MTVRAVLRLLFIVMLTGLSLATVDAQADGVRIVFPRPVTIVRGEVPVVGSANALGQSSYFIQWRQITETLEPVAGPNAALWSPAILPQTDFVDNDLLGTWDTTNLEDGVYELQLVVNVPDQLPLIHTIRPLRVVNQPTGLRGARQAIYQGERFVPSPTPGLPALANPLTAPTATTIPTSIAEATSAAPIATAALAPPATATPDRNVRIEAIIQANVRLGDSTLYPAVGFLEVGESAQVLGISSRSLWLYIRLADGTEGYISPSTLAIRGTTDFLPRIVPPPLPFTRTPVPPFVTELPQPTPAPTSNANLVLTDVDLSDDNPDCAETFDVILQLNNVGSESTANGGTIRVEDIHIESSTVTRIETASFGVLASGEQVEVRVALNVDTFFEEAHRLRITIDALNEVPEFDETDNVYFQDYTLDDSDLCTG